MTFAPKAPTSSSTWLQDDVLLVHGTPRSDEEYFLETVTLQAYESRDPFVHRIETGSAHARYALIERCGPSWKAEIRRVAYDWNSAAADHRALTAASGYHRHVASSIAREDAQPMMNRIQRHKGEAKVQRFDRLAAGQCKSNLDCARAGDRSRLDIMLGPKSEVDARLRTNAYESGRAAAGQYVQWPH